MIDLRISKKIFNDKFYPLLFDYSHRWEIYNGSAGSGKSYFITQKLIVRAIKEPMRIMVCRRYASTIRQTVFSLFKSVITQWQLSPYIKVNDSDYRIKFPNGSEIFFTGLDEETKLLSLDNISTIWVEEAYEASRDIVEQLDLRMRGKSVGQQLILSFNPISKASWLFDFCEINPPQSFIYHHSTYKDNKFLSDEYIASLEELYTRNPQKAKVFCAGEWGVNTDLLVYHNWIVEDFDEYELAKRGLQHRAGMDIGFIDASAICCALYEEKTNTIYVYKDWLSTGCQLDELYDALCELGLKSFYYDSADARAGAYFHKKGLDSKPSIKGADSVRAGIMFLQNHRIVIKPTCKHTIEAFENYCYIKDKKTGEITDKTEHEFSHMCDALRYCFSDIYTKGKLRTIDKSVLGI